MGIGKAPLIKIELENKYLDLMNLVFEGKNMGFYHDRMMKSYLINARNFTKVNMIDKAIDSLLECINHAIKLESSTITKYDQLLLEGIINDTTHTQTNSTLTNKEYISSYIYRNDMSLVRENIRFRKIENLLKKLK